MILAVVVVFVSALCSFAVSAPSPQGAVIINVVTPGSFYFVQNGQEVDYTGNTSPEITDDNGNKLEDYYWKFDLEKTQAKNSAVIGIAPKKQGEIAPGVTFNADDHRISINEAINASISYPIVFVATKYYSYDSSAESKDGSWGKDAENKKDVYTKELDLTYTKEGISQTATITATVTDKGERTDALSFYKTTLGWSISSDAGEISPAKDGGTEGTNTNTTWYLARDDSYNDGLPALRSFIKFKQYHFRVKVDRYIKDDSSGAIKPTKSSYQFNGNDYAEVFSFYAPSDINIGEGSVNGYAFSVNYKDLFDQTNGSNQFFSTDWSYSDNGDGNVYCYWTIKEQINEVESVLKTTKLTFNTPVYTNSSGNETTLTSMDWTFKYTENEKDTYFTNKDIKNKNTSSYTFTLFASKDAVVYVYDENSETYTFTFVGKIGTMSSLKTITASLVQKQGYTIRYVSRKVASSSSSVWDLTNSTSSFNCSEDNEISISVTLDCFGFSFGYTVKGISANNGNSNYGIPTSNINKSSYTVNDVRYTDVLVKVSVLEDNRGLQYGLNVEGYSLPTKEEDLKKWFGNDDWNTLTAKNEFSGWSINLSALEKLGYTISLSSRYNLYTCKINEDNWIKFYSQGSATNYAGQTICFVSTLYGYGQFYCTGTAKWGENNDCGYSKDAYILPLIPRWTSTHTVEIKNDIQTANDGKTQIAGVISSGTIYKNGQTEYTQFDISGYSALEFVNSNSNKAFAIGNEIINSSLYSEHEYSSTGKHYYGLYKYGYSIVGYKVYLNAGTKTYYFVYYNNIWKAYSQENNTINANAIGVLNNTNLGGLVSAVDTFSYGNYTFGDAVIHIEPVWQAVEIEASDSSDNSGKMLINSVTYGGGYKITRPEPTEGNQIAYYKVLKGDIETDYIIVCDDGNGANVVWNYTNIPQSCFVYNENSKHYKLNLKRYEVANVYQLVLSGLEDSDSFVRGDNGYTEGGNSEHKSIYTYADFNLNNANYAEAKNTEAYATEFAEQVELYKASFTDSTTGGVKANLLDKVFDGKNAIKYIFAVHDQQLSVPNFARAYNTLVLWSFDGQSNFENWQNFWINDEVKNAYASVAEENGYSPESTTQFPDKFSFTDDFSQTLVARFWRESYVFDFDTLLVTTLANGNEQSTGAFVGYLAIKVEDKADGKYSGSYILYYNGEIKQLYSYSGSDFGALSSMSLVKNSTLEQDKQDKNIIDDSSLRVYSNSVVTVSVIDQSKITDLTVDNDFYDSMIGYRWKEMSLDVDGNSATADRNADYLCIFDATGFDKESKQTLFTVSGVDVGEYKPPINRNSKIKIDFKFEAIQYDITVELKDTAGGYLFVGSKYVSDITLNKLTVGSTQSIYYYAYAGYGLADPAFTIRVTGGSYGAGSNVGIDSLDSKGEKYQDLDAQTYKLTISGAWLRLYYYQYCEGNIDKDVLTCSADPTQTLKPMTVQNCYINFDVKYYVFDQTDLTETLNGEGGLVQSDWNLDELINWTLTDTTISQNGDIITYYYQNGTQRYAILSSWAYQPKSITNQNLKHADYEFLLKNQPKQTISLTTDELFNMLDITPGRIVPTDERTIYFVIKVAKLYEFNLQIENVDDDTKCSNRSATVTNGKNPQNTFTVTRKDETDVVSCTGYTYENLSNAILASYDSDYYTDVKAVVKYTGDVNGEEIAIPSTFKLTGNATISVIFTPKELEIKTIYIYNNRQLEESEVGEYITNLTITNDRNSKNGTVVAGTQITVEYTVGESYLVDVKANGSYLSGENQYTVKTSDYPHGALTILFEINDKQGGEISLQVLVNSDNNVVYDSDYDTLTEYVHLYINGAEMLDNKGTFRRNYPVKITIDSLPASYKLVGYKQGKYGMLTTVKNANNPINITDGKKPDDLTEDVFITSISGVYYLVFEKVNIKTQLILEESNYNNYTYKSLGVEGVKSNNLVTLAKGSGVGDELTIVRNSNLAYEEFEYGYYYLDSMQKIDGMSLQITDSIIQGVLARDDQTLIIKIVSKSKYRITVSVDKDDNETLQYLSTVKVGENTLPNATTMYSQYYSQNTTVKFEVESKIEGKYVITISGDASAFGTKISQDVKLTSNKLIIIQIRKQDFSLTTNEYLFDDIISIENNSPTNLVDDQVINGAISTSGYKYDVQKTVEFKSLDGTGENKKQLTLLEFENEVLSFKFNMDWNSSNLYSCFEVKTSDGEEIENDQISISKSSVIGINLTLTINLDGQTYNFTLQRLDNGTVKLTFNGIGDANLNLTYTAVKAIS